MPAAVPRLKPGDGFTESEAIPSTAFSGKIVNIRDARTPSPYSSSLSSSGAALLTVQSPAGKTLLATCRVAASDLWFGRSCTVSYNSTTNNHAANAHISFPPPPSGGAGLAPLTPNSTPPPATTPLKALLESPTFPNPSAAAILVYISGPPSSSSPASTRTHPASPPKLTLPIRDDTGCATLTLWGVAATCGAAARWKPLDTQLVITNPNLTTYADRLCVSLSSASTLTATTMDGEFSSSSSSSSLARYIRIAHPHVRKFPWTATQWQGVWWAGGRRKVLYTLEQLDDAASLAVTRGKGGGGGNGRVVGWVSLVLVEVDAIGLKKRNMLFVGECCGLPAYSSTKHFCKACNAQVDLSPNPSIIKLAADESGCISGNDIVFSSRIWKTLFSPLEGKGEEGLEDMDVEDIERWQREVEFKRMAFAVAWDARVGLLAVWDVWGT